MYKQRIFSERPSVRKSLADRYSVICNNLRRIGIEPALWSLNAAGAMSLDLAWDGADLLIQKTASGTIGRRYVHGPSKMQNRDRSGDGVLDMISQLLKIIPVLLSIFGLYVLFDYLFGGVVITNIRLAFPSPIPTIIFYLFIGIAIFVPPLISKKREVHRDWKVGPFTIGKNGKEKLVFGFVFISTLIFSSITFFVMLF